MGSFDSISNDNEKSSLDDYSYYDYNKHDFAMKVFGVMAIQALVTTLFTYFAVSNNGLEFYFNKANPIFLYSIIALIGIMCLLLCCKKIARTGPNDYILFGFFTICKSYLLATIVSEYDPESALMAPVCEAIVFLILVSSTGNLEQAVEYKIPIFVAFVVLAYLVLILGLVFPSLAYNLIIYCLILMIIFIFVICDVYSMDQRHRLRKDEYIIGALLVYLDMICPIFFF